MTSYLPEVLNNNYGTIYENITNTKSLRKKYIDEIAVLAKSFGLTNDQKSTMLTQFMMNAYTSELQEISKLTIATLESQVNNDKVVAEKDLLVSQKNEIDEKKKNYQYERTLTRQQATESKARVKQIASATALATSQAAGEDAKAKSYVAQTNLIAQQEVTERYNGAYKRREIFAIDEGLLVKKAEYLSNVASFAVNSDGVSGASTIVTTMNASVDALSPVESASTSILKFGADNIVSTETTIVAPTLHTITPLSDITLEL